MTRPATLLIARASKDPRRPHPDELIGRGCHRIEPVAMAPRLDALDPGNDEYDPRRHVFPSAVEAEPLESPLFRDATAAKPGQGSPSSLDRRVSDPDFLALGEAATQRLEARDEDAAATSSSERSSGSGRSRSQPKPSRIAELIGSEGACAKGRVLVPQSAVAAAANSSIGGEAAPEGTESSDEKNGTSPKAEKTASRSIRRRGWKVLKSIPNRIKRTLDSMKYPTNEPVPAHVI